MSKIVWDVSASLDGFTAGREVSEQEPMGIGGEDLHGWMFAEGNEIDTGVRRDVDAAAGATVIGRRTFDLGHPHWGGTPWPGTAGFVVTHRGGDDFTADNGGTFHFDADLVSAARRALEAAGDKAVIVLGAEIGRQLLNAGLVDEIWLHQVPVLLGGSAPLFAGVQVSLTPLETRVGSVTHLYYRVNR